MRFGILKAKGWSRLFFAISLGLLGLFVISAGYLRLQGALDHDPILGTLTILLGLGTVIGAIFLGRPSKHWRDGYRTFYGAVWDPSQLKYFSGNFLLKVADGHSVIDLIALSEDHPQCIQNECPELILRLYVASGVTQTGLKLRSAYFAGKRDINGARLKILVGDEIWQFNGTPGARSFYEKTWLMRPEGSYACPVIDSSSERENGQPRGRIGPHTRRCCCRRRSFRGYGGRPPNWLSGRPGHR